MIEIVNPSHPDKLCDRIAGAIVDLCHSRQNCPKVAVEAILGHGYCTVIVESSVNLTVDDVRPIVDRIAGEGIELKLISVPQDKHLSENQEGEIRCGDNGIFRGEPMSPEEIELSSIAHKIYERYPTDGKYIFDEKSGRLIVCQSCCDSNELKTWLEYEYPEYKITVNPLGDWTGGPGVDTGEVNRKIGSDLGVAITGGGLCGKDCTKGDCSINIYAFLEAQRTRKSQKFFCAIGDTDVNGIPYSEIVKKAKEYIDTIGGFESFSCWGIHQ